MTEVKGFHHIEAAVNSGRAVQILYGHFSTLELGGRWLAEQFPIYATSKRYHHPLSHYLIISNRERYLQAVLMPDQLKSTTALLRQGAAVSFMLDLNFDTPDCVMSPFLGHPASTIPMLGKLAKRYDTLVVPMRCYRLNNDRGYGVEFSPAIDNFGEGSDQEIADRMNQIIGSDVRANPEQYYWIHRRFKTQRNAPSPYTTKSA